MKKKNYISPVLIEYPIKPVKLLSGSSYDTYDTMRWNTNEDDGEDGYTYDTF